MPLCPAIRFPARFQSLCLLPAIFGVIVALAGSTGAGEKVTDIGSRRELFVDRHLISQIRGAELRLHPPRRAETALKFDSPWDGATAAYVTVFRDGDLFRMYYRGAPSTSKVENTCYAESRDGINWTKPKLGLFEWEGSKENNIVWMGDGTHNFTPFRDTNPDVKKDAQYKALGRAQRGSGKKGLYAFASPDGIHWRKLSEELVLTKGAFDSQNLGFWDTKKKKYVSYYRIFTEGVRAIALAESDDFIHWSAPEQIKVEGPPEHFYTNATTQYFRAPHYYFAFPKRFARDRRKLADHPSAGISEGVFLSSRDGLNFDRTFMEALIRPGRDQRNWGDRGTMPAWGLIQTADDEMSIWYSQHYRFDSHHLERGVFRLDGIASAHAGYDGGELITKPVTFRGKKLHLNYATSAIGSVRIELQDATGKPLPGYALKDAPELYGDEIDATYTWKSGEDLSRLKGQPVRLRFVLKDADVYSYRFGE